MGACRRVARIAREGARVAVGTRARVRGVGDCGAQKALERHTGAASKRSVAPTDVASGWLVATFALVDARIFSGPSTRRRRTRRCAFAARGRSAGAPRHHTIGAAGVRSRLRPTEPARERAGLACAAGAHGIRPDDRGARGAGRGRARAATELPAGQARVSAARGVAFIARVVAHVVGDPRAGRRLCGVRHDSIAARRRRARPSGKARVSPACMRSALRKTWPALVVAFVAVSSRADTVGACNGEARRARRRCAGAAAERPRT